MRLFNSFTIPKKENCDLCRIEKNKKKAVENNLLDNLNRQRFDFVFDWPATTSAKPLTNNNVYYETEGSMLLTEKFNTFIRTAQ